LTAELEATLGMRFHRSWVDGLAMGDGPAWRGGRLEGVTMPGSPRGVPDLTIGRDGRREPGLSGGLGSYTGAVGMIAFPDDGRSVGAGGVPRALAEYVNQGIAWPEEVGLPQAGYEREQFRGMGMAVIPAPDSGHHTGLNQFGEPAVDRWHEVCAGTNCGPMTEDTANAPFDQRVMDPPPAEVCACSIYTEDNYEPQESKREETVCAGLLETTRGWDAGRARSTNVEPPDLHRITQYSIAATNITSRRELRSQDRGRTFTQVEATRSTFTTANQAASTVTVRGDATVVQTPRYDARGHLRDEGCVTKADGTPGRVFQYDHAGRLTGAYTRAADGRADVPLARFAHDAAGRLASATYNRGFIDGGDPADSTLDNDVTDLYVHDPSWRIVAVVRREAGPAEDASVRAWVRERWVHHRAGDGEGGVVAVAAGDDSPAARFIDDDGDGTFETAQHFLCNRRGDVVAIVEPGVDADASDGSDRATVPGRVIARVWYDDYGLPRVHTPLDVNQDGVSDLADLATFAERLERFGALASDPQTLRDAMRLRNQLDWDRDGAVMEADGAAFAADLASHVGERFDARETLGNLPLYAGAWWDAWLEVYHVRHRVLDPKEGRWLQRDPIGYAGGSNLYAYVGNQPGRYVDPLGLRWLAAGGGGAGAGGDREECRRDERWVEQPSALGALFDGLVSNLGNWGDAATRDHGPGPRPAAPRDAGANQGFNPIDEAMHAVDVADRTGNYSLAALSTSRFTASEFDEFTENLATGLQVAEIAASLAFEPLDMAMALAAIAEDPGEWTAWAAALPFVPSAIVKAGTKYSRHALRTNLIAAGEVFRKGELYDAHHLVGNSDDSRRFLHPLFEKFAMDINGAENGLKLHRHFHWQLNTNEYRDSVIELLRNAKSETELRERLEQLKHRLKRMESEFLSDNPKGSPCTENLQ
jgi:RHS repeat-associated protein